jgi:UDP-N-acetylglucosamine 2-epimerase (non-hydrolysing)
MKFITVLGDTLDSIRLSLIIKKLDRYCNHVLVYTGQKLDDSFSPISFHQLDLRDPDYCLGIQANTFGEEIGKILSEAEKIILKEKPDRMLIAGGANSGLASIIAKRMGIPVFHIGAGNRCFDYRVPQEINRTIIDHCSTILLPYISRGKENLRKEGISNEAIYVIGNPMSEVISHYSGEIERTKILDKLGLKPQNYFVAAIHQPETANDEYNFKGMFTGLDRISAEYNFPIICSMDPKIKLKMAQFNLQITNKNITITDTLSFFDLIKLERNAACVITDSGAIQEDCYLLGIPAITITEATEIPDTIESGNNMLASSSPKIMLKAMEIMLTEKRQDNPQLAYLNKNISSKVVKIILGHLNNRQNPVTKFP